MKITVFASLAMSCALAITPFAVVDSFGSSRIGAHTVSNFKSISSIRSLKSLSRPVVQAATIQPAAELPAESAPTDAKAKPTVETRNSDAYLMASNSGDDGAASPFSRRPQVVEKSGVHGGAVTPKSAVGLVGLVTMLADTPEPGSLFLLGTGLLGAAMALFWKSAKSTRS